jgi:3-deoxy-manno-octulosonate cytidylyltransferase (CMP-KDO synthetase)
MLQDKRFIGIIPARYASTRFPGKPLADIRGKSMVQRVYEQASAALETVYVATDDDRIFSAVRSFGGNVVLTSPLHNSGTDRCAEALLLAEQEMGISFNAVLNVQGDEPFIAQEQLELVKSCFADEQVQIATLVKPVKSLEELLNPNRPKVVVGSDMQALYFSRAVIPHVRGSKQEDWLAVHTFYSHIGLYGFRRDILPRITALPQSPLELAESLEQLRWIESGFHITVRVTPYESFGVDAPEDLERLVKE